MKPKRRLKLVFPPMRCDEGCGQCCGPAPATKAELAAVQRYITANGIVPVDQGLTCPFYQSGRCAVHPVRPRICQAFGHVEMLTCPRGYNENVDEQRAKAWLLSAGPAEDTLHSFLPTRSPLELALRGMARDRQASPKR